MAIKAKEQAIIDLVINGQQANASLRELSGAYNALLSNVSRLRQADNPALYAQQTAALQRVLAARNAERQAIMGTTQAIQEEEKASKGFFANFKKGFSEISEMAGSITAGTLLYKGISAGLSFIKDVWAGSEAAYKEADLTQTALQNKLTQTGAVVGKNIESLQKLQQTLMDQTGVDDDIIAKGEDVVLSYESIRGVIYDQVIPAAVNLTAAQNKGIVTMDGMSASSELLAKILEKPAAAKKRLLGIGINLTEQQEKEINTLIRQNKLQDAQQIILDQVNKRYGNLAETLSHTEAGEMQRFETRLGNIQESLGKLIISGKAVVANFFSPLLDVLGPLLERLSGASTSAKQLADEFYRQKDAVSNLERNTKPLIDRYDELKEKGNLNKAEQIELNTIINTLASTIPTAVTQWDKYGNALGINTDKAREFIKMQQAMLKIKNKEAIDESENTIEALEARAGRIQGLLTYGKKTVAGSRSESATTLPERKLTAEEILEYSDDLKKLKQQVDDLKLGVRGLKGESIDIPGATKPPPLVTGPTEADIKAEANAKAVAERKAAAYSKELEDVRSEYLQLADAAQKGTVDGLDAQLAVIDAKFNKVVAKLQKLSKDPKLGKEFLADIKFINGQGGLRDQEKATAFTKTNSDALAGQFKGASDNIDSAFAQGQSELDGAMNDQLNDVSATDPAVVEARRLDIQQIYAQKKYDLEQKHLEDMKTLYQAYGVSTSDLDHKIAENTIKENNRAAKEKLEKEKAYTIAKKTLQQEQMDAVQDTAQAFENALAKNTIAYKAALIVDKAVAVANINIQTELSIAKFKASVAGLGPFGVSMGIAYEVAARISEAASIANIIKSVADGLGGSKGAGKAAKGGTFEGPGHDQGGLNVVDPRTGETVVNVEGGEPWMVLSRETRRNNGPLINELLFNSMYRNGARVDVPGVTRGITMARNGGVFDNGQSGASPLQGSAGSGGTGISSGDVEKLMAKLDQVHQAIQTQEVIFNDRVYDNYRAKKIAIRNGAQG